MNSICKSFAKSPPILDQLSLRVESGTRIGIFGKNGVGKSTLLRIIATLVQPDKGEIYWNGTLVGFDHPNWRKKIRYLSGEENGFFSQLTGYDNLDFWFAQYSLHFDRSNIPELLRPLMEKEYQLYSSGMKQMLALYRAICTEPSILLLDEPFKHLDSENRALTMELIKTHCEKAAILFTGHSLPDLANICNHSYELKNGILF